MSKKKNGSKSKSTGDTGSLVDVTDTKFAVDVARQILGKHADDKWILGETATAVHHVLSLWIEHSSEIQRIAKKADALAITFNIKSSRASTPPVVKVGGSYNEKHPMKAESDAIDPDQMEMFQTGAKPTSETPEEQPEEV